MSVIRKADWEVRPVSISVARRMVERYHYARSASLIAVYLHGMFPAGAFWDEEAVAVAWWLPPTKGCGQATYPDAPQGVLSLSRLVAIPEAPKNTCSYLIARSIKLIDRRRWPCLVTYADTMREHTGAIYRATNWKYAGMTAADPCYMIGGRMVSRKAGPKTRTHAEMMALGAEMVGKFSKHKFVMMPKQ